MSKLDNKYDYHLHSLFSSDCETELRDIIASAKSHGLRGICLTDHNDLNYPETPDNIIFDLEIDSYITTLSELSMELLPDFDLRIGVEQGVMPSTCEELSSYSTKHPGIDFIICSSHVVDSLDPYYPEAFKNPDGSYKDINVIYRHYFEDILYNVEHFSDYNVYGHLDYIFRYGPEKVTAESFSKRHFPALKELIHEILKVIIENGKGIEINTGSLYRGMDYMHPHVEILKMYKELGGEILTFGSDAHDTEHIGYMIEDATELAQAIGFRYFSTFKAMKPEFIKL